MSRKLEILVWAIGGASMISLALALGSMWPVPIGVIFFLVALIELMMSLP